MLLAAAAQLWQSTKARCPKMDFIVEIPPCRPHIDSYGQQQYCNCPKRAGRAGKIPLNVVDSTGFHLLSSPFCVHGKKTNLLHRGQMLGMATSRGIEGRLAKAHPARTSSTLDGRTCVSLSRHHHLCRVPAAPASLPSTIQAAILSGGDTLGRCWLAAAKPAGPHSAPVPLKTRSLLRQIDVQTTQ